MIRWGRKNRGKGGGWFALPKQPVSGSAAQPTALVRMAHPTDPTLYYDSKTAGWVTTNYTVWTAREWRARFANGQHAATKWEQFGYIIPLYDDDDPNKTR
jgi:hypothetical protein